jgi:hypothetical protein
MAKHPDVNHLDREERIRAIAYALWEEEGHPEGRHEEHWFRATELVDSEAMAKPGTGKVTEPAWLKRRKAAETPAAEVGAESDHNERHQRRNSGAKVA